MKKLVLILILIGTAALVYLNEPQIAQAIKQKIYFSVCDSPISYRIGQIDPKFNLTGQELAQDLEKASQIWNTHYPKPLITYDPKSKLSVNMVYDSRQSLTNKISQIENNLKSQDQNLKPQAQEYEKRLADFKQNVAQLNADIESWNAKGGAPPDEYEKLKQRQQDLQKEATDLNAMAKSLNQTAQSYNADVNQLNSTIETFNQTLVVKPEEGLYDPQASTIDIYFNINQTELIHTLAHELGHAIGLTHVSAPTAIMYTQTNNSLKLSAEDLTALENLCQPHSVFENFQNELKLLLRNRLAFLISHYTKQY